MKSKILIFIFLGFTQPSFGFQDLGLDTLNKDTTIIYDELVISAHRQLSNKFDRPEAIYILGGEALSTNTPMSLAHAMSQMPGVWMQKTNHGGGSPFLRGLTGYQTLILIDGIRFNNSTFRSGPNQYLNTIDPYTLERIEILRGQGSVQYGSDAIGGVRTQESVLGGNECFMLLLLLEHMAGHETLLFGLLFSQEEAAAGCRGPDGSHSRLAHPW